MILLSLFGRLLRINLINESFIQFYSMNNIMTNNYIYYHFLGQLLMINFIKELFILY